MVTVKTNIENTAEEKLRETEQERDKLRREIAELNEE